MASFLGMPIVDKCPCGKAVSPDTAPQELVKDENADVIFRLCSECVKRKRDDK